MCLDQYVTSYIFNNFFIEYLVNNREDETRGVTHEKKNHFIKCISSLAQLVYDVFPVILQVLLSQRYLETNHNS